ncbi:hypothetical protein KPH14_001320 [Odynerus spinipes]|uniref:ribonuclease H n=1 Tax=Odynerus spinipes TaxID=1348599 RepID=A0AAD9VLH4_9HYME|nr:hypothetical protein KPH14_001320 [Odynerus spinipes]
MPLSYAFVINRNSQTASGGVAILVKNNLIANEIQTNYNMEVITTKVRLSWDLTICNLYLPNSQELNERDINQLLSNLPKPFIILDLYDSDHFPVIAKIFTNQNHKQNEFSPRWKFEPADWNEYRRLIDLDLPHPVSYLNYNPPQIDNIIDEFVSTLKRAADQAIPKTRRINLNILRKVPWWNNSCETAVKNAKRAFNKYKKHSNTENLISFKKFRAIARSTIRSSKKKSWTDFLASLNSNAPSKELWNKIKSIQEELHLKISSNSLLRLPKFPPWKIQHIETDTQLETYLKNDTPPEIFRALVMEILNNHQDYQQIYTDGSKTTTGTGYAIYSSDFQIKKKLSDDTLIFIAELTAIFQAFRMAHVKNYRKTIILTDSKSAITAITNQGFRNEIVTKIFETHQNVLKKGNQVKIVWIPSHIGIAGNEKVDKEAKEAANLLTTNKEDQLHLDDLIRTLKNKLTAQWENEWKTKAPNHIKTISDKFFEDQKCPFTLTRREQAAIARIKIGHSRITHSFRISKNQPPYCEQCKSVISIEHLILHCAKYSLLRDRYNLATTLKDNLNHKKLPELLKFIKETKLINVIL